MLANTVSRMGANFESVHWRSGGTSSGPAAFGLLTVTNEQPEPPSSTNQAHAQAVTRRTARRIQRSRSMRGRRDLAIKNLAEATRK